MARQTAEASCAGGERPATIAVMNVYDSDFDRPKGVRITALRIIQVLPKSTPPPNEPRIGVADQTNARAALGTVPVESDGSAYFEAPVGKALYFQALDASGMAVQSMRSATYVHPGEQLTCQGCHEPRVNRPAPPHRCWRCGAPSDHGRGRLEPVQLCASGAAGARPQLRGLPPGAEGARSARGD
jgi:hypothetical protein